jgi:hypothetical protein
MKLRTLMTISAVVACPSGLAYMIMPAPIFGSSGLHLIDGGVLVARMYGAQVFGIGILAWLTRGLPPSEPRQLIVRCFCLLDVLNLAMALTAVLSGMKNSSGWLDVAGFSFFAAGYAYFGFLKPEVSKRSDA